MIMIIIVYNKWLTKQINTEMKLYDWDSSQLLLEFSDQFQLLNYKVYQKIEYIYVNWKITRR